ncbi:type VI secretion system-associated protein [Salinibacter sp. 10B]|uniref:type VI secretion system baseplate subunit TssK n=1 Tax=Salinibacter sp. 10B TaxID=1923971 RepID=UPI000CF4486C|nr:type VI secretion system baseplate subunit TssK [Salinibacter sp. 10B]PQJ33916.1 type VI secretion system-associated protein [Salinibacter sp. 10B]
MAQDRKRVVWFEGMTLDPHHFQQWDRHHQEVLNTRLQEIAPDGWGMSHCQIDRERLANGEFSLQEFSGIMPDGLVLDVPGTSPVPQSRSVQEHFPSTEERMRVLVAVPAHRTGGRNVQLRGNNGVRDPRYIAESSSIEDENSGENPRPVEVAHTNVQVRFESESQRGYSTMPIAEVERSGSGFALNRTFVPPCLSIAASEQLSEIARQMLELLVARSADLREYKEDAFAQRELAPSDILSLNLLGTLNAYIPEIRHYHLHNQTHPRRLFQTLATLAGKLCTYLDDAPVEPRGIPTYDHASPGRAFNKIEEILREMLGEATPSADYEHIDLQQARENVYTGSVKQAVIEKAQLFLVTRSEQHSESELTEAMPRMLRVASPDTIDDVLQSYTQALSVEATRRLPANMPVDNQATYFRLEKRGPFWDSIQTEGGIAIFVPSDFQDVDVRLIAAR